MTACSSRGPMMGSKRPTCELLLDHEGPHGAEVDGVWVQWDRVVDPEMMILPVGAAPGELDELAILLDRLTPHDAAECRRLARRILEAGFRKIPKDGTTMVPAPENGFDL